MNSVLDSQAIAIPCPKCGHQSSHTIRKLKTNPHLTCSGCGQGFQIDATDMRRKIAEVEKTLANFKRTLSRLGK